MRLPELPFGLGSQTGSQNRSPAPEIALTLRTNQPRITYETEGHRFESCRARFGSGLTADEALCAAPEPRRKGAVKRTGKQSWLSVGIPDRCYEARSSARNACGVSMRTPPCSPTGRRCLRSPETSTSTSAATAQPRIRSSSGSPVRPATFPAGDAWKSDATSWSRARASFRRSASKPSLSTSTRANSISDGSSRTRLRLPSTASSITLPGGPSAMKADTRTLVSQAIRKLSVALPGRRRPDLRCLRARSPRLQRGFGRISEGRRTVPA